MATRWRVALVFDIMATSSDEAKDHAMDLVNQIDVEPHDVTFECIETSGTVGEVFAAKLGPIGDGQ